MIIFRVLENLMKSIICKKKHRILLLCILSALFLVTYDMAKISQNYADRCEKFILKRKLTYDSLETTSYISREENLMIQRSLNLDRVCEQLKTNMEQKCTLKNHFLQDPNTGTIYCFLHKVASSTWMSFFSRLENDANFLERAEETGKYYKIADRLQANKWDVLDPDNFAFIVVRHPLDRLISAFTDRILNTDTDQSKYHTKRILKHGRNSKQKKPTFNQFLSYIAAGGTDTHWSPYYKDCSPCQVQYDWIIKLEDENIKHLEDLLSNTTGMNNYATLMVKHKSKESSKLKRHFYRNVNCRTLKNIVRIYDMDFKLFQYSATEYLASEGIKIQC